MKARHIIASLLLMLLSIGTSAQGIEFLPEGATFSQAVEFAQRDGRKIFLDCYTSWCGPCKKMARDIFPQQKVGDFMNPQFVCIKIDMEKGEGPELMKKFDITAFPTFIIFNSDGKEIGRWMGGADAERFIEKVKEHSTLPSSATMDERFASGERNPEFLSDYLQTLGAKFKRVQANEVAETLLNGKAETFASDEYLRSVFMSYLQNPFHPSFVHTAKNPQAMAEAVGQEALQAKMERVWTTYPRTLITETDTLVTVDEHKWKAFVDLMEECDAPDRDRIRLTSQMTFAEKKGDWAAYTTNFKQLYATVDVNDLDLCKLSTPLVKDCTDTALRAEVKGILQDRLAKLKSGEREPLRRIGNMQLSGNIDKAIEMLIGRL